MSVPISQFIPPTLSPANRKFVFYISDSTEEAFINQVGKKQYFAFLSLGHSGVCSMDPYIQSGTHDYRDGDHHDLSIMEFPLTVLAWLCQCWMLTWQDHGPTLSSGYGTIPGGTVKLFVTMLYHCILPFTDKGNPLFWQR